MRRTIALAVLIMMLALPVASLACKDAQFDLWLTFPSCSTSGHGYKTIDMGYVGDWAVSYTGSCTLSSYWGAAHVQGNYGGNVWNYYYSATGMPCDWHSLGTLVGSMNACDCVNSSGTLSGSADITDARYFMIAYNTTLTKCCWNPYAETWGEGTLTATPQRDPVNPPSVPEPGTIVAACSILAPVGFVFRRRSK